VEPPLAVDVGRGWLLLRDGGGRVRDLEDVDAVVASLVELLPRYAHLQRAGAAHVHDMVALGVPDHRPPELVGALRRLLRRRDLLVGDFEDALDDVAVDELESLLPRIGAALARLHGGPIPASIEHNDLHDGNIFFADRGRVFDWGDAVIGHPCFSVAILGNSIADRFELPADAAPLRHLRAAYADAWADLAPIEEVERLTGDAISLGSASRAVGWGRVLDLIPPSEMEPWRAGASAWLGELLGVARDLPDE
jgi:Ser/Thr protein kinase RdoA (MazF antagonist)